MTRLSRFSRAAGPPERRSPSERGLGPALAAPAILAALSAGCLVPQSIDKSSTSPHPPPRIVIEKIPVEQNIPFLALTRVPRDAPCTCQVVLDIPVVEEDDTSIALAARLFVDYDIRDTSKQNLADFKTIPAPDDFTQTERTGPQFAQAADALGDGMHTIDVVVADSTAFLDNDDPTNKLPWRQLKPDFAAATYRFLVQVKTDPDAARCVDDGVTFKRVCPTGTP